MARARVAGAAGEEHDEAPDVTPGADGSGKDTRGSYGEEHPATVPPLEGEPPPLLEGDDEDGGVLERLDTKVAPAKPKKAPTGHRWAVAKARLRRESGDVEPESEILLSQKEFDHFAATGAVEELKVRK